jgi:hypothetical protein
LKSLQNDQVIIAGQEVELTDLVTSQIFPEMLMFAKL